jgi:hypothetical protein
MTTTTPNDVSQMAVAAELAISPRRVRQLIGEGVLPGPDAAGCYNVQRCADRHALFLSRHDAAAWSSFEEQLVRDTRRVERLLATALRPAASGPQLRAASIAVQRLFADLSFMTRCRSKTPAERDLFLGLWREKEDRALGALVSQVATVM